MVSGLTFPGRQGSLLSFADHGDTQIACLLDGALVLLAGRKGILHLVTPCNIWSHLATPGHLFLAGREFYRNKVLYMTFASLSDWQIGDFFLDTIITLKVHYRMVQKW